MNSTLQTYHAAMRALEHIEADNTATTEEKELARAFYDDAKIKWETEREALSEQARVQYATDSAREEVTRKPSAPVESPLQQVKRLIKECRKALYVSRDENKALYAQLAANRETKRRLNEEYTQLRERKKQLETVSP